MTSWGIKESAASAKCCINSWILKYKDIILTLLYLRYFKVRVAKKYLTTKAWVSSIKTPMKTDTDIFLTPLQT